MLFVILFILFLICASSCTYRYKYTECVPHAKVENDRQPCLTVCRDGNRFVVKPATSHYQLHSS